MPNQNGVFKNRTDLRSDGGIDENLKDIAKNLNWDVRHNLLHSSVSQEVKNLLTSMKQDEVLSQILKTIKEQAKANASAESFKTANLALFAWLVNGQKYDLLNGYPIFSRKTNDRGNETITYLGGKDGILAPVERWPESSRSFVTIFPPDLVISSKYSHPDKLTIWDTLQNQKLVFCEPILNSVGKISDENFGHLLSFGEPLDENTDHEITNVSMTDIAFLSLQDRGIYERVRHSKEQARVFIQFLLDFAVNFDQSAIEPKKLLCSKCGKEHNMYASNWLLILKTQKWIPVGKGQDFPNSKNLADLLRNQPLITNKMMEDKPSKFFNNLNVSVTDIMKSIIATSEKERLALDRATGRLYQSFGNNTQQLTELAELLGDEPNILQEFKQRLNEREKIRRNQLIGATVEGIFRSIFSKDEFKDEGFKIDRTGVGSDYAIEYDFIGGDKEQLLTIERANKKLLIELKSTSEDVVKMTTTQGQEAVNNSGNYALCVVTITGGSIDETLVRNNSRFVLDIGQRLVDKVNSVDELKHKSDEVTSTGGEVGVEVIEGQIRFKISKQLWERGKTFEELCDYLRSSL